MNVVEIENKLFSDKVVLFRDKALHVIAYKGKYYFSLRELMEKLPVSRHNKEMKQAFAFKGRKILCFRDEREHCIEVDVVKKYFQQLIKKMPESVLKSDYRFLTNDLHQLSLEQCFLKVDAGEITEEEVIRISNHALIRSIERCGIEDDVELMNRINDAMIIKETDKHIYKKDDENVYVLSKRDKPKSLVTIMYWEEFQSNMEEKMERYDAV